MCPFEEELARREAVRQHEAAIEALVKARQQLQIEFNAAMERHDKEFLETQRRRQEEFLEVQQCQDRIRRENAEQDAADAKAAALAQQQLWELFLKAVSKPVQVAPLFPDCELAHVDNLSESSKVPLGPDRDLAQVDIQVRNGPQRRFKPPEAIRTVHLVPDHDLAHRRLLRLRRPRRHCRPPRLHLQRQVAATQGAPAARIIRPP